MMYPYRNPNGGLGQPPAAPAPPPSPPSDGQVDTKAKKRTWIGLGILVAIPLIAYMVGSARGG